MKKIVIGTALAIAAATAFAADVSVSAVRDHASSANGVRLETAVPVIPGGLKASVTSIEQLGNRVAIGKDFALTTVGPVALGATVAAVYQNSTGAASNGYGMTVGAGASYAITKNVKAVVGVERFIGQERVSQFNGNLATVGLNIKF